MTSYPVTLHVKSLAKSNYPECSRSSYPSSLRRLAGRSVLYVGGSMAAFRVQAVSADPCSRTGTFGTKHSRTWKGPVSCYYL